MNSPPALDDLAARAARAASSTRPANARRGPRRRGRRARRAPGSRRRPARPARLPTTATDGGRGGGVADDDAGAVDGSGGAGRVARALDAAPAARAPRARRRRRARREHAPARGHPGEAIGDRHAPVAAERLRVQLQPRRRLPPLVLRAVDHAGDALAPSPGRRGRRGRSRRARGRARRTPRGSGRGARTAAATGRRAGRRAAPPRRPVDDGRGDDLAPGPLVEPAREREHPRLRHVLDRCEAAGGVAVERRVADRRLRLVRRRQHQEPVLVRQGHHDHAADAGLQVLRREAARAGQLLAEVRAQLLDRELLEADAEALAEPAGVRAGLARRCSASAWRCPRRGPARAPRPPAPPRAPSRCRRRPRSARARSRSSPRSRAGR